MSNLQPYVCGVIPPHILNKLAEDPDQEAREQARRTRVDISELAFGRERMLLPQPPPAPAARDHQHRRLEPQCRRRRGAVCRRLRRHDLQDVRRHGLDLAPRPEGDERPLRQASVAIEFANELGLSLDSDRLYAFSQNTANTVYNGAFLT